MVISTKTKQLLLKLFPERHINYLGSRGVTGIISAFDSEYPEYLSKTEKPPKFLCYTGDISLLQNIDNNIAVIGTRDTTKDIVSRETKAVEFLVSNNKIIVSGLAIGCDTISHETCIKHGGKTIAILNQPPVIDWVYPKEKFISCGNNR